MGQRRPRRRKTEGRGGSALLRRLGRVGAALAIAIQLLMPVIAMPPPALAETSREAEILAQASAVWGSAALCELGTPAREGEQNPLLAHPCPICWAAQQAASLLPPNLPLLPLAPMPVWLKAPAFADDFALPRTLSPAQPRGPPSV